MAPILICLAVGVRVSAFDLALLLLRVQPEARVVDTLEEQVDVPEGLQVDDDFDDGAQRHYFLLSFLLCSIELTQPGLFNFCFVYYNSS